MELLQEVELKFLVLETLLNNKIREIELNFENYITEWKI